MSIFDRLQHRITDKADKADIPVIPLSRLSVIQRVEYQNIHRVLTKLRCIQPFRAGDSLQWRGQPTPEQRQLLQDYESELVAALTPRALTKDEAATFALWLNNIGESDKKERDHAFSTANATPSDRVALLWMASDSPELAERK